MKSLPPILAAVAIVLLLSGVYMGTYYAIMTPVNVVETSRLGMPGNGVHMEPKYDYRGTIADVLFVPANLIDRQLRPQVWTPPASDLDFEFQFDTFLRAVPASS